MKYYLTQDCKYVKGATGGAVYDLFGSKLYHLNKDACEVLECAINGTLNSLPQNESMACLNKFIELNVITDTPTDEKNLSYLPHMVYAWLELTEKCNMDCIHCYGEFGHPKQHGNDERLTVTEWKSILDGLYRTGLRDVQFIGGEPLVYPHIKDLLEYANDIGLSVDIFTNGYFIDSSLISVLRHTNTKIRLSLYGYDSDSHDSITHCRGSFLHIDKAIDLLQENNIETSIAVVIMRENERYFDKIKQYVESKGHYFSYDVIRPVVCGNQSAHCISRESIISSRYYTKPTFSISSENYYKNKNWNSCWFGKLAITSTGDILPCTFARQVVCGNIRKDSKETIQNRLIHYWKMSKDHIQECKLCEYRYACHDCRPLAMGVFGNIFGKYPRCCYDPQNGIWGDLKDVLIENKEILL